MIRGQLRHDELRNGQEKRFWRLRRPLRDMLAERLRLWADRVDQLLESFCVGNLLCTTF